jgi:hypothetical protein
VGQSFVTFIPDFFDEFDVPSPIISQSTGLPRGAVLRGHNSGIDLFTFTFTELQTMVVGLHLIELQFAHQPFQRCSGSVE